VPNSITLAGSELSEPELASVMEFGFVFTRCDRRSDRSRERSLRRSHRVNKALVFHIPIDTKHVTHFGDVLRRQFLGLLKN